MSMHVQPLDPVPEETAKIARKSFPKGSLAMMLRDALDGVYSDESFRHVYPKRGRGAIAPWRLAIVMVLQAIEALSDVQAAEMVRGRLDWKYALSLPIDDMGFDPSILTDFRQRLVDHQAQELLLTPILEICVQRGWIREKGKYRMDSTMVLSSARKINSVESVGESLRNALNVLAEEEPEWLITVVSPEWFDRYVHRFELQRFPKGKQAQDDMVATVGEDTWTLLKAVEHASAPKGLLGLKAISFLRKVWEQHYEVVGNHVKWRDGPVVCNTDRLITPYDEDARESKKRETEWLGYKVHLVETCSEDEKVHLITHVQTTRATVQDTEQTTILLQSLREKGYAVQEVVADSGYVSGQHLVEQRRIGCDLIGPALPDTSWQKKKGYGLEAFSLDWEAKKATCPQGKTSQQWAKGRGNRGEETVNIAFARQTCQACEARAFCTKSVKGGRTLTLFPKEVHEALQERRKQQRGEAFQKKYAIRSGIEGTLSEGVRAHGMRRSKYRGMEKTHLHMISIAAGMNIIRIYHMLEREKAGLSPRRGRSRTFFERLRGRVSA